YGQLPPAPAEIHTLSLHDALPISISARSIWTSAKPRGGGGRRTCRSRSLAAPREESSPAPPRWSVKRSSGEARRCRRTRRALHRSEEHTPELQPREQLARRLLHAK